MIKLCNVVSYNGNTHIVIAMFDGKQIQFVTDKNIVTNSIYVEKTKDGFKVVERITDKEAKEEKFKLKEEK